MNSLFSSFRQVPMALRLRWVLFYLVSLASIFLFYAFLVFNGSSRAAQQWGIVSIVIFTLEWLYFGRFLNQNHREGETEVLPTFGPGNSLSLLRGTLLAMIAGFLFLPRPLGLLAWGPAALYIISDFTDFFDGYLARRANHATRLGETLDMDLDSLGVFVVVLLSIQYGVLPWWYLSVALARYLFVFGIWWRTRRDLPIYDLRPSTSRRVIAGLQMGFLTAMLFPVLGPPATYLGAVLFFLPFSIGFLYDWLQVSGVVQEPSEQQAKWINRIWNFATGWLPTVLRIAIVVVLIYFLRYVTFVNPNRLDVFAPRGMPNPSVTLFVFWVIELLILIVLGLGAAGRITAIVALIYTGIKLQFEPLTWPYWILTISYTAILFLGTGKYALWKPEDTWHIRRGARAETQEEER
ncbi:MAG: CDP-alcohol phosphatidyltransferase family protein [Chloroflexi bacterium]|nr:CDP-alcohol phosphatidyltransferase family protein [Chloroflexota bacterium]